MKRALFSGVLLCASTAHAGTTVTLDSISADGQELRDLSCELTGGGLFASMQVVAAIAGQKSAFDACKPEGAAFRAAWSWSGGATTGVSISAASAPEASACVTKALEAVSATLTGSCKGTILVGEATAAEAAATELETAVTTPAPAPESADTPAKRAE